MHVIEAPAVISPEHQNAGFPYGSRAMPQASSQAATVTAIPYYAWAHRGLDGMRVFIPEARP